MVRSPSSTMHNGGTQNGAPDPFYTSRVRDSPSADSAVERIWSVAERHAVQVDQHRFRNCWRDGAAEIQPTGLLWRVVQPIPLAESVDGIQHPSASQQGTDSRSF